MADEIKSILAAQVEPQSFRGADFRVVFSNYSRMRVAPTDLAVTFGYSDVIPVAGAELNKTGLNVVEEKVSVVLTPHHAKLLALALRGAINAYERDYGKIAITLKPPIGIEKLTAAVKAEMDGET